MRGRLEKDLRQNPNISWDKFSQEPHFTVAHYAGKVKYQIEGMVEKNKVCVENDTSVADHRHVAEAPIFT